MYLVSRYVTKSPATAHRDLVTYVSCRMIFEKNFLYKSDEIYKYLFLKKYKQDIETNVVGSCLCQISVIALGNHSREDEVYRC